MLQELTDTIFNVSYCDIMNKFERGYVPVFSIILTSRKRIYVLVTGIIILIAGYKAII